MKHLFVFLFVLFALWAVGVYFLNPTHESDVPVLYWVTDRNPVRNEQVERFHTWMAKNGYPEVELRLDTSNSDVSKKIIQGVSGVGSDVMDVPSDQISFFVRMGLLSDVTEPAAQMGFDVGHTYKALTDTLTINGRQYAFPANIDVSGLIINVDQLNRVGVSLPSGKWTVKEFEEKGLEYIKKANKGLPRQLYYYSGPVVDRISTLRGMGGSVLNETLTAPTLNSPEYIQTLAMLKRWIDLGITPSAADVQSMSTDSGYGGATFQLFNSGNYAMMPVGRHAIIQLRLISDANLSVVPPPADVLPNVTIRSRAVGVYSGGRHPELAAYFLAFLASDAYNETVVESGDALPGSPEIAKTEAYSKPEKFPREWDFHKHFAEYAEEISIPLAISPYILPAVVSRTEKDAFDGVAANMRTPEQAAQIAHTALENELKRTLREHVALQEDYNLWAERQKKIDALKAEGKKIPAEWVRNPFHQVYYKKLGILEEPVAKPAASAAAKAEPTTEAKPETEAKPTAGAAPKAGAASQAEVASQAEATSQAEVTRKAGAASGAESALGAEGKDSAKGKSSAKGKGSADAAKDAVSGIWPQSPSGTSGIAAAAMLLPTLPVAATAAN